MFGRGYTWRNIGYKETPPKPLYHDTEAHIGVVLYKILTVKKMLKNLVVMVMTSITCSLVDGLFHFFQYQRDILSVQSLVTNVDVGEFGQDLPHLFRGVFLGRESQKDRNDGLVEGLR